MASIAQEESRSISQNVTWGKRASFQQGKVSFAYKRFLGYKKENNKIVIDEDEAVIVKLIYRMFLVEGKSITGIANHLTKLNVKTPSGKSTKWTKNTLNSILTNEKYKGDALLQKSYTEDYLSQKLVKNTGQNPQYYVENNHPAIIDRDTWESVQIELARRDASSTPASASRMMLKASSAFLPLRSSTVKSMRDRLSETLSPFPIVISPRIPLTFTKALFRLSVELPDILAT
ncbi:MAG: hypothetical protein GX242_01725 [Clostridiales bacterium]|nr:hypothetical protein [Clostridiales bacterium]